MMVVWATEWAEASSEESPDLVRVNAEDSEGIPQAPDGVGGGVSGGRPGRESLF